MSDRGPEIVVIEDNPNDAELITRVPKKHDLASGIILLKDGEEALDFLLPAEGKPINHVPKVILLDLKLPKVDGIEVLRRLKSDSRTKTIPVVVLTSSTEERDLKEAYSLGANSYIAKPIRFDEFTKAVTELVSYWLGLNKCCG